VIDGPFTQRKTSYGCTMCDVLISCVTDCRTVLLGKVTSERDELREEVARLRRITSTLAPSASPAPAAVSPGARPAVVTRIGAGARSSTSAGATSVAGRRGTGPSTTVGGRGAAATTAAVRVAGEHDRQQAAQNVLVMELNSQVSYRLYHLLTRHRACKSNICLT
jgi:hypothetical protein